MAVFKTPATRKLFILGHGSYVTVKLCQTNYSIWKSPFLRAYILIIILECPLGGPDEVDAFTLQVRVSTSSLWALVKSRWELPSVTLESTKHCSLDCHHRYWFLGTKWQYNVCQKEKKKRTADLQSEDLNPSRYIWLTSSHISSKWL